MTKHYFTLLALGDSYTIGESVPIHESFPYQAVSMLRKEGLHFHAPEIVATTGWTSNELAAHLLHIPLNEQYDFVTLLIGVNNQYRGLPVAEFATDLEFLIHKAVHLADEKAERVIVVSIPDWGVTPFADLKDRKNISSEIDAFNGECKRLADAAKVHYIDITELSREAAKDGSLLASDKLHYAGKAYTMWAEKITGLIKSIIRS